MQPEHSYWRNGSRTEKTGRLMYKGAFSFWLRNEKYKLLYEQKPIMKKEEDKMVELGACIIGGGAFLVWFIVRWAILDHEYFKQKEAWKSDPNFKWNWN